MPRKQSVQYEEIHLESTKKLSGSQSKSEAIKGSLGSSDGIISSSDDKPQEKRKKPEGGKLKDGLTNNVTTLQTENFFHSKKFNFKAQSEEYRTDKRISQKQSQVEKLESELQKNSTAQQQPLESFNNLSQSDRSKSTIFRMLVYGAIKMKTQRQLEFYLQTFCSSVRDKHLKEEVEEYFQKYNTPFRLKKDHQQDVSKYQKRISELLRKQSKKEIISEEHAVTVAKQLRLQNFFHQFLAYYTRLIFSTKYIMRFRDFLFPVYQTYHTVKHFYNQQGKTKQCRRIYRGIKLTRKQYQNIKEEDYLQLLGFMSASTSEKTVLDNFTLPLKTQPQTDIYLLQFQIGQEPTKDQYRKLDHGFFINHQNEFQEQEVILNAMNIVKVLGKQSEKIIKDGQQVRLNRIVLQYGAIFECMDKNVKQLEQRKQEIEMIAYYKFQIQKIQASDLGDIFLKFGQIEHFKNHYELLKKEAEGSVKNTFQINQKLFSNYSSLGNTEQAIKYKKLNADLLPLLQRELDDEKQKIMFKSSKTCDNRIEELKLKKNDLISAGTNADHAQTLLGYRFNQEYIRKIKNYQQFSQLTLYCTAVFRCFNLIEENFSLIAQKYAQLMIQRERSEKPDSTLGTRNSSGSADKQTAKEQEVNTIVQNWENINLQYLEYMKLKLEIGKETINVFLIDQFKMMYDKYFETGQICCCQPIQQSKWLKKRLTIFDMSLPKEYRQLKQLDLSMIYEEIADLKSQLEQERKKPHPNLPKFLNPLIATEKALSKNQCDSIFEALSSQKNQKGQGTVINEQKMIEIRNQYRSCRFTLKEVIEHISELKGEEKTKQANEIEVEIIALDFKMENYKSSSLEIDTYVRAIQCSGTIEKVQATYYKGLIQFSRGEYEITEKTLDETIQDLKQVVCKQVKQISPTGISGQKIRQIAQKILWGLPIYHGVLKSALENLIVLETQKQDFYQVYVSGLSKIQNLLQELKNCQSYLNESKNGSHILEVDILKFEGLICKFNLQEIIEFDTDVQKNHKNFQNRNNFCKFNESLLASVKKSKKLQGSSVLETMRLNAEYIKAVDPVKSFEKHCIPKLAQIRRGLEAYFDKQLEGNANCYFYFLIQASCYESRNKIIAKRKQQLGEKEFKQYLENVLTDQQKNDFEVLELYKKAIKCMEVCHSPENIRLINAHLTICRFILGLKGDNNINEHQQLKREKQKSIRKLQQMQAELRQQISETKEDYLKKYQSEPYRQELDLKNRIYTQVTNLLRVQKRGSNGAFSTEK